jgi:ribosome-associated toxin RatA of RatAB toxin-antitoxin module
MATTHTAEHRISVDAPADTVYRIIEDVTAWPRIFPPTVYVDRLTADENTERIRIWATANGEVKTWTSKRTLDADARTITFRQEVSQHPVAAMGGTWIITPVTDTSCEVVLLHDFQAVDDLPANVTWIEQAIDRNSGAELGTLKATAESTELDELLLTFDDHLEIEGSVQDVYDFIWNAEKWEERLPHVARVDLGVLGDDLQTLEMDTKANDGSQHTTRSVRVGFAPGHLVYKQLLVPALLTAHVGEWILEPSASGLVATSRHTVVIKPSAIPAILGENATVADARAFLRNALGTNSLTTLRYAKDHAEALGPVSTG